LTFLEVPYFFGHGTGISTIIATNISQNLEPKIRHFR
jgi:hypothetical protein